MDGLTPPANSPLPPFNTAFEEMKAGQSVKHITRVFREAAKLAESKPLPNFETVRWWVRQAMKHHVGFRQEPYDIEQAWRRWQNRTHGWCPEGKHQLTEANTYYRVVCRAGHPTHKLKQCRACRAARNRQLRKRGLPTTLPAPDFTAADWDDFRRTISRVGSEGIGIMLLRALKSYIKLHGRPRKREVVNHKE